MIAGPLMPGVGATANEPIDLSVTKQNETTKNHSPLIHYDLQIVKGRLNVLFQKAAAQSREKKIKEAADLVKKKKERLWNTRVYPLSSSEGQNYPTNRQSVCYGQQPPPSLFG